MGGKFAKKDGGQGLILSQTEHILKGSEHLPVLPDVVGTEPEVIKFLGTLLPPPTRGEACPDPGGERRGRGTQRAENGPIRISRDSDWFSRPTALDPLARSGLERQKLSPPAAMWGAVPVPRKIPRGGCLGAG